MEVKSKIPLKKIILLVVIYIAFISLGLPDSILGAGWPSMHTDLKSPLHFAGIISMIIAGGTVISSLFSAKLIRKYDVPLVTAFSVLMTALALLGFSYSNNFIYLCFLAIPLGLGAGCVDAALNNYVALHFEARHMNWLHCFWGVGASLGPIIMANYLSTGSSWTNGYNTIGWIQIGLVCVLFVSFPLWIKRKNETKNEGSGVITFKNLIKLPGIKQVLIICFCYCTIEATFGLWGASYLVEIRDIKPNQGAKLVAYYYIGITLGRFISGVLTSIFNNKQLIYIGQVVIVIGIMVNLLPYYSCILPGFFLIGLGLAPIYPSLLHDTPKNFGEQHSQSIMGIQMASAYIGTTLMPMIFGLLASLFSYSLLLAFLFSILLIMFLMTIRLNAIIKKSS